MSDTQNPVYADRATVFGDGTEAHPLSGIIDWPLGFPVKNLKVLEFAGQATANGQNPFYTVPIRRRAIFASVTVLNISGSNAAIAPFVEIGGTFFTLNAGGLIANNANNSFLPLRYIAEAGESFSINSTSAPGQPYNFSCVIFEFSDTSNAASAKLSPSGIAAGNNTIFTCPAGSLKALLTQPDLPVGVNFSGTLIAGGSVGVSNESGATRTYSVFLVPSGSSPLSSNELAIAKTVNNLASAYILTPVHVLNPGDSIVVNSDSAAAGQLIFVNYCLI